MNGEQNVIGGFGGAPADPDAAAAIANAVAEAIAEAGQRADAHLTEPSTDRPTNGIESISVFKAC